MRIFETSEYINMVMEYQAGGTLADLIQSSAIMGSKIAEDHVRLITE